MNNDSWVCESCGNNMMRLTHLELENEIKKLQIELEQSKIDVHNSDYERNMETSKLQDEVDRLHIERDNALKKVSVEAMFANTLAVALDQYSAGHLTPVATEALLKYYKHKEIE